MNRKQPARSVRGPSSGKNGKRGSAISERELEFSPSIRDRFKEWRLGLNLDGEALLKGLVCGILLIFFSLLQTTLFTRFRPFGAVPDLILPLVTAVAMTERERWGAVFGLIAAVVIESLGGAPLTLLPILYAAAGYLCGILTVLYFKDGWAVRLLYTLAGSAARTVFTAISLMATVGGINLLTLFTSALIPEFFATVVFAAFPHLLAKLCLRPFNRPRDEKVK